MPRATTTTATIRTSLVLAALAILITTACVPVAPPGGPAAGGHPVQPELAALTVAQEDTSASYDRDQWGDWASHGHGCNTRELVLTDQGHGTTPGKGCRPVCPGTGPACWTSTYDGAHLRDVAQVQIDHRVPLAEAHRSGAAGWTSAQRERFYNDPANLIVASVRSNTSKGDDDPARWRPANRAAWCDYATAYVTTKSTYGLSVDPAERDALAQMLAACPSQGR